MNTTVNNTFVNLSNEITNLSNTRLSTFIEGVNNATELSQLKNWSYNELLTATTKCNNFTLDELKAYLIKRKTKLEGIRLEKELSSIKAIFNAPLFKGGSVSVEWKKSAMWGSNPTADASLSNEKEYNRFCSGSIGGCGYDKLSTAVANCMNQDNSFLRLMYDLKDKNIGVENRELFGYGSGSFVLPRLEGGVGVSCYPQIFKTLGFEFKQKASGKTYDYFEITKAV